MIPDGGVGTGVDRFTGQGTAASWRGSIFYQSATQGLARLTGMAVVFEYEVDENDNVRGSFWEWK
jgi:hypothetical protein